MSVGQSTQHHDIPYWTESSSQESTSYISESEEREASEGERVTFSIHRSMPVVAQYKTLSLDVDHSTGLRHPMTSSQHSMTSSSSQWTTVCSSTDPHCLSCHPL